MGYPRQQIRDFYMTCRFSTSAAPSVSEVFPTAKGATTEARRPGIRFSVDYSPVAD